VEQAVLKPERMHTMGQFGGMAILWVVLIGQSDSAQPPDSPPEIDAREAQAAQEEMQAVRRIGITTVGLLGSPFGQGPLLASYAVMAEQIKVVHDAYNEQCTYRMREAAAGRGSADFLWESSWNLLQMELLHCSRKIDRVAAFAAHLERIRLAEECYKLQANPSNGFEPMMQRRAAEALLKQVMAEPE
jgi:hypothetical protein